MAVLDTSGVFSEGDAYRVIMVLDVPFGTYTLSCVSGCLNELETMSPIAAADLVALLDAYDVANATETEANLEQAGGGKVLVKADVLEWEVVNGGASGAAQEKGKIRSDIAQIMSFCVCLAGYVTNYAGGTSLIRS